jgi:microcin C transport system substrate-binding protein
MGAVAAPGVATCLSAFAGTAQAQEVFGPPAHGMSVFGDLKYPAGFRHFDYVNPAAPVGGAFITQITSISGNQNFETFNTLNIFVLKGVGAAGMSAIYDSLMSSSADEPDGMYGLVAESVAVSPDGLAYRFVLRPQARFHDGSRITPADIVFTIDTLKTKGHPNIALSLRDVTGAREDGPDAVVVTFAKGRSRTLPLMVAGLPIFSKAYYATREFDAATLESPLGCGAYKVGRFEVGRFIVFERVADYWGAELPVNAGHNNFDRIRYEYFRDEEARFQAFTSGIIVFREEFTSRTWATRYTFPAFTEGRVKREIVPDETPSGTQGWLFNLRRDVFKDARIREALGLAFDFEWTNANVMFASYARTRSYFGNSEMEAKGLPQGRERELLEGLRGRVPDEVFGEPFSPPVSDGSGQDRNLLRRASQMLAAAGCKRERDRLLTPAGRPFEFEFLDRDERLQPHTQPFIKNLRLLGIDARPRVVDPSQYQLRLNDFDFDIVSSRTVMSLTPGEGLRLMFGSTAANTRGSSNIAGIADPAIDTLLDAVIAADTRSELYAACRALDRVLRAGRYWVPAWHKPESWLAYWDMFGRPEKLPRYGHGAPGIWWHDADKARRIGKG